MNEKSLVLLERALKSACMDWDGDFKWLLELQDSEELHYYDVTIYHKHMEHTIVSFTARVDIIKDEVEMELGEENWHKLDTENLFTFMFFETAQQLHNARS